MAARLERINRFLDGIKRNKRDIMSPEGVVLEVDVANHGERLTAFALDVLFWCLASLLLFLMLGLLIREKVNISVSVTIVLFLAFLLRNLYFIHFELTTQGSTPGKRIVGLRVIDRNGGPLLPGAIVARNLTREVEVFLPLGLLFTLAGGGWLAWSYFGWIILISGLPLFNRDHLRAGDLIAGTMVISVGRRRLLPELVASSAAYVFSRQQLETYGTFELQVLEELLRRVPSADTTQVQQDVLNRITKKIGWVQPIAPGETKAFLTAFYTAERAHLEREQLFGKYRPDKESAVINEVDG